MVSTEVEVGGTIDSEASRLLRCHSRVPAHLNGSLIRPCTYACVTAVPCVWCGGLVTVPNDRKQDR